MPALALNKPNLSLPGRGGRSRALVGLDIQPGYAAAVQAHVNGGVVVQQAAGTALPPDALREGEVLDEALLSEALRELFAGAKLGKRVRVGLANQRTVLRTLELPPIEDRKQLAAAVRSQAEDQVPMPLANAVLDFHSLGIHDTPAGPRQRVIVVAAQREMVERLLRAVRQAGLRPEGVDLSAFALIRSLYRPGPAPADGQALARVLYLNVGGLTNMAIAEGSVCRFTRVVGGGLEAMASEIAERRGIPLVDARTLLAGFDLRHAAAAAAANAFAAPAAVPARAPAVEPAAVAAEPVMVADGEDHADEPDLQATPPAPEPIETWALAQDPSGAQAAAQNVSPQSASQQPSSQPATAPEPPPAAPAPAQVAPTRSGSSGDAEVRMVLENGIREIVGEVRNSLDFHRSQEGGGEVSSVVLSGPALDLSGFAEALEADLGLAVTRQAVNGMTGGVFASVSAHRLAIATGLATEEAPR
jgi:type IV pilus assembly protein PilM